MNVLCERTCVSSTPRTKLLMLAIAMLLTSQVARASASNPIQVENAKQGDASWRLTKSALNDEIEGYASAVSVNRGETITFFVNTQSPQFTLQIFRMGWYGGAGGRLMMPAITLPGITQPPPSQDLSTGLIECHWTPSFILNVPGDPSDPTNWLSGIYLVKLTSLSDGKQRYIVFVVRDDSRASDFLFQNSVATYLAYNDWGGSSLYSKPRAYKVSFDRPLRKGYGAGDFVAWGWENSVLRFLEREGSDVSYTTDLETHARGDLLLNHKALLVVGHDEYWSWQMRDNVESARDHGVSLGFFGANIAYWQVRFEPSTFTGAPNRTMVCYKLALLDPYLNDSNPDHKHLVTTRFRMAPVNRPEDALIGVMYETGNIGGDLIISDASHWVFQGTGLQDGDKLAKLLGYEADRKFDQSPLGIETLAHSPYQADVKAQDACSGSGNCTTRFADMTIYEAKSGATVFATGTMHWNWGLTSLNPTNQDYSKQAVQQATRNILNRFLNPLAFYLQPRSLSFPDHILGTSTSQDVVLFNRKKEPLFVREITLNSREFSFGDGCPFVLDPGEGCTLSVKFEPLTVGASKSELTVFTSLDSQQKVQLTGKGVDFSLEAAPNSSTIATVPAGQNVSYQVSVVPAGFSGTVALSCVADSPGARCVTTPSTVNLNGSDPVLVTVMAGTNPMSSPPSPPSPSPNSPNLALLISSLRPRLWTLYFLLALTLLRWRWRRKLTRAGVAVAALVCLAVLCVGCLEGPHEVHLLVKAQAAGATRTLPLTLKFN